MIDWSTYTDVDLRTEQSAINAEISRRTILAMTPQQIDSLNRSYLTADGVVEGDPWVQPDAVKSAYPLNWIVMHEGGEWQATVMSNVWEPGVFGWTLREEVMAAAQKAAEPWPDWSRPAGPEDGYAIGAQVTHNETHWISDVAENIWEPSVFGWSVAPTA
jgi:hypothetical protein